MNIDYFASSLTLAKRYATRKPLYVGLFCSANVKYILHSTVGRVQNVKHVLHGAKYVLHKIIVKTPLLC